MKIVEESEGEKHLTDTLSGKPPSKSYNPPANVQWWHEVLLPIMAILFVFSLVACVVVRRHRKGSCVLPFGVSKSFFSFL